MKKTIALFILIFTQLSNSQTTYNSSDFATINDVFIVSKTTIGLTSFDFMATGENYNWDFASLGLNSQENTQWIDPNTTGYKTTWCITNGYFVNCNTNFNNSFNLAIKLLDGIEFNGYGVTNLTSHYSKTTTSLTNKMLGGTAVVGAISVPMTINFTTPDIEYQFPIQYNDNYTNNSAFQIDLNSLGVPIQYNSEATRTNLVEGWGSLVTPFGTFQNVLKMKTTLVNNETITTASGPNSTTRTTVTYKWFDPSFGIPVLEVSGELISGNWIPTTANYIDIQRCIEPTALFGYVPLVPDYDSATQSVNVSFINTSLNYDTESWDFGDGNTSTDSNPSHTYTCPGVKQVTLTVTNTFCDPDLTDTITIPIVITDSQNAFTENVTVTSTALIADRNLTGTTYQWVDCNNNNLPIDGETNQAFTPSTSGNYAVILTTNGCQSTSDCYTFEQLGITDFQFSNFILYPNPTHGNLFTNLENEIKRVSIYDWQGKLVATQLNMNGLSDGIYLVKIETETESYLTKVIKM